MVGTRTEQDSINFIKKSIAIIKRDYKKCKGVQSVQMVDRNFCVLIDRVQRHKKLSHQSKVTLCQKIDAERNGLGQIKLPHNRFNYFQPYEQSLTQSVQILSGGANITMQIQACNTYGILDANKLRKLHRTIVLENVLTK